MPVVTSVGKAKYAFGFPESAGKCAFQRAQFRSVGKQYMQILDICDWFRSGLNFMITGDGQETLQNSCLMQGDVGHGP